MPLQITIDKTSCQYISIGISQLTFSRSLIQSIINIILKLSMVNIPILKSNLALIQPRIIKFHNDFLIMIGGYLRSEFQPRRIVIFPEPLNSSSILMFEFFLGQLTFAVEFVIMEQSLVDYLGIYVDHFKFTLSVHLVFFDLAFIEKVVRHIQETFAMIIIKRIDGHNLLYFIGFLQYLPMKFFLLTITQTDLQAHCPILHNNPLHLTINLCTTSAGAILTSQIPHQIIQIQSLQYKSVNSQKMGNQNTKTAESADIDISYDYREVYKNQYGMVLQNKQTRETFVMKENTYVSSAIYEQDRHRLEKQMQDESICENILRVKKIKTHTFHGLCSTSHKIYAIYQYPQVTLHDEIMARQKEYKSFDENELWSILQCCNVALAELKPIVSMNAHQVFITPEGVLKIIHNDLVDENYRFMINENYYYAPEKIRNFNRSDNEVSLIKEAVFSMGMTLLQASLLQNSLNCYNFQERMFLETNLQSLLYILSQRYSQDFVQIIQNMLSINPLDRPVYHQIQKLLDNFWLNQSNYENQSGTNNEQSIKIQAYNDKKIIFTSTQSNGIYKNLATINSQHKDSVRIEESRDERHCKPKIVQSKIEQKYVAPEIKCGKQPLRSKESAKTNHLQSKDQESPMQMGTNKHQNRQQNIYTDPQLLIMIKKDLQDINKLKQSTLKETIKYSFLYPQTQSIFSSIKDIKLSSLHDHLTSNRKPEQSIPLKERQLNIPEFNHQYKVEGKQLKETKEERISQFKKQKMNIEKIEDFQGEDSEGKLYKGQMINGKKNGWGKLYFQDEAYYEGQFKNDEINGRGILYYYENKPAYDGMWLDGKFHGQGILYNRDPYQLSMPFDYRDFDQVQEYWLKYQGQFFQDCKSGNGKLYLSNNEILQGRFQNDQINGPCNFLSMEGEFISGCWQENKLINIEL